MYVYIYMCVYNYVYIYMCLFARQCAMGKLVAPHSNRNQEHAQNHAFSKRPAPPKVCVFRDSNSQVVCLLPEPAGKQPLPLQRLRSRL